MRMSAHTWVEKWCMTAMEIQASKEAVRKGSVRASDTNTSKPLSAQIWIRALLRSQPTWKDTKQTRFLIAFLQNNYISIGDFYILYQTFWNMEDIFITFQMKMKPSLNFQA